MRHKLPTTWDLSPFYKSDTDPKIAQDLKRSADRVRIFVKTWQADESYLSNPTRLKQALDEYEELERTTGLSSGYGYYLSLRLAQEENNPKLKAAASKLKDHAIGLANEIEFFTIRLAKVPTSIQQKFLVDKNLAPYHYFLKKLFEHAKYILSEPEEKIMNLKSAPAHGYWTEMRSNLMAEEMLTVKDEQGVRRSRPFSEALNLSSSAKKSVRDEAAKAVHQLMKTYARIAEHEINAILEDKKINDQLRGFSRPDQSRHLSDDIDTEVVDAMIKAVSDNFDIAHKFYKLKAKLAKLPKLAYHERNLAYGQTDKKITYSESVDLVSRSLHNLDSEFGTIFDRFATNGQIDVYPKQNRSDGAFCAGTGELPSLPTYILLNHTDKLRDTLTLAHEAGHGINNELIKPKQHSLYYSTPLSTAEVASTFMEDFVLQEIAKEANDELRLGLMMTKLNDDISTIFRQVACYKFEQELHETFRQEGFLPKEKIGQIFQKHMKAYMGPSVSQDPGSENWWVYWSHIRNFFYVYSYASGLIISKALQAEVKADKKFVEKVKYFLSAGTSNSPKNIFKNIGIDITKTDFWTSGVKEIRDLLAETEKLAKKLKKC
ncbi:MAG: M3 family oligoendopeptidase [Candidatus Vogelbacteria bacterium]|nr:M3 family oligoendopeptidase [Candidatus Vogelbacteria bacterium]